MFLGSGMCGGRNGGGLLEDSVGQSGTEFRMGLCCLLTLLVAGMAIMKDTALPQKVKAYMVLFLGYLTSHLAGDWALASVHRSMQ